MSEQSLDDLGALEFLKEVLQATAQSNDDKEIVYGLLEKNTDQLNDNFAEILRLWVTDEFEEAEADQALIIAAVIFSFGNLIRQFPWGDTDSNLEIAIACYETSLKGFTYEACPEFWTLGKLYLGEDYQERKKGDKAENIEKAIALYKATLQVYNRESDSHNWAKTQLGLGRAYMNRLKGDKAENIDKAISYFNTALQVYTRESDSHTWATTQIYLGIAYDKRINGNKVENIENAIDYHNAALQVYTSEKFPKYWAMAKLNLGVTYIERLKGDKAEDIDKAIDCFNASKEVHTREAYPYDWASCQNDLGCAYFSRIKGDKAENIEKAIYYYNAALQVRTHEASPYDWSIEQNNLGIAYKDRINGDKAENIEKAIYYYNAALQVRTQEAYSYDWAMTQNNLGLAYIDRIKEDKAENMEKAIAAFNAALQIRTREKFPQYWAMTQMNLGLAYSERIQGNETENQKKAIAANNYALQIYTYQAFPQKNAETLKNLGIFYQTKYRFDDAYNTYTSAISKVELLRGEIISGEESKRKQAEEWNVLYLRMVEVCLELKEETLALEYIERSKTRNLVELILERDRKTIFPPNVVTQLEQLRDEISTGQYQIQNSTAENPTNLSQHLQELRQQKKNLEDKYLPVGSGFDFKKFQATLDKNTAVIEWYITSSGLETFIITSDNLQRLNSSTSTDNLKAFADWNLNYLNAYYSNKDEWKDNLASSLNQLAEILNIEEILKLIPKNCSHLTLIPHRYLHLFPLHALPLSDGNFLCYKFPDGVSYAPSCQLLQQLNLRQRINFKSLFAIQNPTEDLEYTDLEVETISSLFTNKEILFKKQASQTALSQASSQIQQANYLHFSCHGTFNLNSPQDSCLVLAGAVENGKLNLNKCLTLGNLFERDFNLNQCRLVVLSACETGLIDFQNTSDEYIGLPSGFLYAGSSSVVSSLWTVNDFSTSFLMIKFIQNLKNIENISVPIALNQAQTWLREATKEDLQEWVNNLPLNNVLQKMNLMTRFKNIEANSKPFQSPLYWATFTVVGN
ncbi:MAG: CHAT domain-containing protein [Cyanobacteria bacterium P01_A01_bin.68]